MFVSAQNSCVEIFIPHIIVLGGGFGTLLGLKGEILKNGISALMKETPHSSLAPLFFQWCYVNIQGTLSPFLSHHMHEYTHSHVHTYGCKHDIWGINSHHFFLIYLQNANAWSSTCGSSRSCRNLDYYPIGSYLQIPLMFNIKSRRERPS